MNTTDKLELSIKLLREWQHRLYVKSRGIKEDLETCPTHDQSLWHCGTACCAWGYLAACPEICSMGVARVSDGVMYQGAGGHTGISLFYGLSSDWSSQVFGPRLRTLELIIQDLMLTRFALEGGKVA